MNWRCQRVFWLFFFFSICRKSKSERTTDLEINLIQTKNAWQARFPQKIESTEFIFWMLSILNLQWIPNSNDDSSLFWLKYKNVRERERENIEGTCIENAQHCDEQAFTHYCIAIIHLNRKQKPSSNSTIEVEQFNDFNEI